MMTFSDLLLLLQHATDPADIFGPPGDDPQVAIRRCYRSLMTLAHPDHNPDQQQQATEVCQQLQTWYSMAQQRLAEGSYGAPLRISALTRRHHYRGYAAPLAGDLCDLFPVSVAG